VTDTIFFIFHDLGIGGVQRKIVDSIRLLRKDPYFQKKRFKIIVLLEDEKAYDLEEDIFLKDIEGLEHEVYYYKSKKDIDFSTFHIPFTLFILWKILIFKPSRVVAFMEPYAASAIIGKLVSKIFWRGYTKVIISFDNVATSLLKLEYDRNWRYFYWTFLIKNLFKFADTVIVPSDFSKSDMVNNFSLPNEKIVVNKNWVLIPKKMERRFLKYDLLYVGRVDRVKNLKLFVDTVRELRGRVPNIRGCIVGWGDEMENILHYINSKKMGGNIEMVGSRRDVGFYYSSSKIFLITSDFEGLPIVGLEAMSWRLPVVSKDYPGAGELVKDAKSGYVCNKKQLTERILELLHDTAKREAMGKYAKDYVRKNHGAKSLRDFVKEIV